AWSSGPPGAFRRPCAWGAMTTFFANKRGVPQRSAPSCIPLPLPGTGASGWRPCRFCPLSVVGGGGAWLSHVPRGRYSILSAPCVLGNGQRTTDNGQAMPELYDQIQEAARTVQAKWKGRPRVGIILGTGLGGLVEEIEAEASFPYEELPHFPHSTAPSHEGRLVCGKLEGRTVVAMVGRAHFYEGYSLRQITLPVRVMKALGC